MVFLHAREIYRLDSHQGNIVDSYIDRYEIFNSALDDSQDVMRYYQNCIQFSGCPKILDYQNIMGRYQIFYTEGSYYSGSNQNGICYVSDRTILIYTVMGLAAIAGQGDLVFRLQGNDPIIFMIFLP